VNLLISGRLDEARTAQFEVLDLARATGDERAVHTALLNVAETEFALGDVEGAAAHARENLADELFRKNVALRANQEGNLAAYLLGLERVDEARAVSLDALDHARDAEDHVQAATALQHLAAILARKEPKRAAQLFGYVEATFTQHGVVREFTERFTYDRLMVTLRQTMGDDEITTLGREGAVMTEERAAELALGE